MHYRRYLLSTYFVYHIFSHLILPIGLHRKSKLTLVYLDLFEEAV